MARKAQGVKAARLYAQWHLGDSGWADLIFAAYDAPEQTIRSLAGAGMKAAAELMPEPPPPTED